MSKIGTKNINNYIKYSPIIICILMIIMSVGYAAVNSVDLMISGTSDALMQSGVYITEATYSGDTNAVVENSSIKYVSNTILNSNIELSSDDSSSNITYKLTLYNSNSYDCLFVDAVFDENFYSNSNIIFTLSDNIKSGTLLKSKTYLEIYITFKYIDNVELSEAGSILNAYINIDFIRAPYIVASYDTSGSYSYIIPEDGTYRIQLWGANGYNASHTSQAIGGFTQGDIELTSGTELFVYVGGKGTKLSSTVSGTNDGGGYNGGGNANNDGHSAAGRYGGGGATDVRLVGGEWNLFDSLKSRIMVAGGGGSWSQAPYYGGSAGGLEGYKDVDDYSGYGGTQISGGAGGVGLYGTADAGGFGYGGMGSSYASGGGGGYYGGGGGARDKVDGSGGGGSSFISGHDGCDAIDETSVEDNIIHTGQSIHYSGLKFENTLMIDGNGYTWTNTVSDTSLGNLPGYTSGTTLDLLNLRNGYAIIWRVPTE